MLDYLDLRFNRTAWFREGYIHTATRSVVQPDERTEVKCQLFGLPCQQEREKRRDQPPGQVGGKEERGREFLCVY